MSFGISNSVMSRVVQVCTPELFHQATRSSVVKDVCSQIADALESKRRGEMNNEDFETLKTQLKKRLPILTPHATFRNGRRCNSDAIPSGFSIYDIDHIPNPRGYWEEKKKLLAEKKIGVFMASGDLQAPESKEPAGSKQMISVLDLIVLVHVTPSSEGLRLVFIIPDGMSLADAQKWMSQQLGDGEYDVCVKDLARPSFIVPEDYILFINNEELFKERKFTFNNSITNSDVQDNRLPGTHSHPAVSSGSAIQPAQPCDSNAAHAGNLGSAGGYQIPDGLPTSGTASEKSLIAFDLFTESAGLKNVNIDTEGSRHSSLLAIMSAGASRVMSEEELRRVVAVKMPSFAQERDCQQLIHDFYEKYGDSSKPFSRDVIRINAQAEKQATLSTPNSSLQTPNCEDDYPAPPEMPKKLPKLVELLVSQTPDVYKPAVAHAIFPPLATHLCRTYFNYIDNVEHEATLMCCLLAGTGAGKNCVQMPINLIMEDIRKRDKDNLKREKEWKDEVTRKGANKDKRKRPENLVIQEIDADMTNPAFVMRTAEAQEHFLYTALNEIDQFDNLRGIGNQQFRIMCLAFDPGNQYGQTRVGTQSVTERVTIRFNWNASTTINKGIRYFSKVLTDGPISRINFCTIPEREIGAEMPVYGTYDDTFRENLKPYIEHLNMASGTINCPEAFALAQKLKEENADFARMSQDRVYENLSFRANVIAYLKACVLYVANGCQWESEIEEFVRWSEQYDLYCKMRFFRDAIVKAEQEGVKSSKRGPSNMLQLLPNEFSYQQAEQLRSDLGLDTKGTRRMIATWVFRKYIVKVEAGEQGVNAGNDKADNSHCNYNYGNYSFYRKLCFLKNESK